MRTDDHVARYARGEIGNERRTQLRPLTILRSARTSEALPEISAWNSRLISQTRFVTALDLVVARSAQVLQIDAVHGLEQNTALVIASDHHLHERCELGFGGVRPFADRGFLLVQRFEIEPGQGQEGNALGTGDPLLADDLIEMAGGARSIRTCLRS